jgi:Tat protein translocase TatB subunit
MNIGWTEFLVIAMIGLIVFGPERLPEMSAQFAKFIKTARTKANDLRGLTPRGLTTNAVTSVAGLTGLSGQTRTSATGSAKVNPVFDPDAT